MSSHLSPQKLAEELERRYSAYLRSSFYFKRPDLRASFERALKDYALIKGPFPEAGAEFQKGAHAHDLARQLLREEAEGILPAMLNGELWTHQELAVQAVEDGRNIVVATGTASGKTESFLYPILFHLYRQHLAGELGAGVRALILYPMNALAHDQRKRLGDISNNLREAGSDFRFTFGQYIGDTPQKGGESRAYPGELASRERMQDTPPHILLTNYSMLEYLLIRPDDHRLFKQGEHWRFIVLDEAHQYRGAKGIEMSMLIRRLKRRLSESERPQIGGFTCIATSATVSSGEGDKDRVAVKDFAGNLFGEPFTREDIIFGNREKKDDSRPRRHHIFLRALEGAFIVYGKNGEEVKINRGQREDGLRAIEIALCRECGQHYFVGRDDGGVLKEAIRDFSNDKFGAEFFRPLDEGDENGGRLMLCRICGKIGSRLSCGCNPAGRIRVEKCPSHDDHRDRLKSCRSCGYSRIDPVHEVVHGSDGPNAVIATVMHQSLPPKRRRILAFADSRQEAAFFAWYAQSSYEGIRDRNLIFRALSASGKHADPMSLEDLAQKLARVCEQENMFPETDTRAKKMRQVWKMIYRELLSEEPRISLEGVGLARWFPLLPKGLEVPRQLSRAPWNLDATQAQNLFVTMLDYLRVARVVELLQDSESQWADLGLHSQQRVYSGLKPTRAREALVCWEGRQGRAERKSAKFLVRLLGQKGGDGKKAVDAAQSALISMWGAILAHDGKVRPEERILVTENGQTFRLNLRWWRVATVSKDGLFQCGTCARIQNVDIEGLCLRSGCPGKVQSIPVGGGENLRGDHYRRLYEDKNLPAVMRSKEHTAQLTSEEAQERQREFLDGHIHVLSSSTTFEVGVDLGNLDVAFMRNVPPEAFNYTQRAGRAGRRDTPGVVVTYCRRNPHDLYHFANPEKRILKGEIRPPMLNVKNPKIIRRHMTAAALSRFFRDNPDRYPSVDALFGGDIEHPQAVSDFKAYCERHADSLRESFLKIVPDDKETVREMGLLDGGWIDLIAGERSRFADAEAETRSDYVAMREAVSKFSDMEEFDKAKRANQRAKSIKKGRVLPFLSRKAVIPKYGFPVDVVELDTGRATLESGKVELQRDLTLAIAEFAPGCKLVANKLEWSSAGIKRVEGEQHGWEVMSYRRCSNCNSFVHWQEDSTPAPQCCDNPDTGRPRKYLIPRFGFVTPMHEKVREPKGRTFRLYTTRPFLVQRDRKPESDSEIFGVRLTKSCPGEMAVLCEGKNGRDFYICRACGAGFAENTGEHKTPYGMGCKAKPIPIALGHKFVTDVVRMDFPLKSGQLGGFDDSFSLACALVEGAAKVLEAPSTDLNAVLDKCPDRNAIHPIVLYDNVPGGAGLVARMDDPGVFAEVLNAAKDRVSGECGCDDSCYGCLRNYRNQFAHTQLRRIPVFEYLKQLIGD